MPRNSLKVLGSTTLAVDQERSKLDYYGTDPKSVRSLIENECFEGINVWEPCAGHHLLSDVLEKEWGFTVRKSDITEYEGYEHEILDFLKYDGTWDGEIITNPPYDLSTEFVIKALSIMKPGQKLAVYIRMQWLEGNSRYEKIFKDNPPKTIYIFVNRQVCSKNDDFTGSSAVAFVWIVWEKDFVGDPIIKWLKNN